jgi:hypothetical protein
VKVAGDEIVRRRRLSSTLLSLNTFSAILCKLQRNTINGELYSLEWLNCGVDKEELSLVVDIIIDISQFKNNKINRNRRRKQSRVYYGVQRK